MNYQKYELPGNVYDDWAKCECRGFLPTARQQNVIAAMQSALSAGLYYTSDVVPHCAGLLKPNAEQAAEGRGRVENGTFGMDCYYARKYTDAVALFKKMDAAMAELKPYKGQKLGTLMFNDFKRNTGVVVTEVVGNDCIQIAGKRGSLALAWSANAIQIVCAINRAAERKLRKDDFVAFASQMGAPKVAQPAMDEQTLSLMF